MLSACSKVTYADRDPFFSAGMVGQQMLRDSI
jgi:hypothetical protein